MKRFILTLVCSVLAAHLSAADGYLIEGKVLEMFPGERALLLEHPGVEDILEPGELEVRVGKSGMAIDYTGREVRGRLTRKGEQWWLERIWPHDPTGRGIMDEVNRRFHRETATQGRRAIRMRGDFLPNFALFDEEGKVVQRTDLQGNYLVVNFIFTRCPDPNMCPASTARMGEMQRLIMERGWERVHQVSITMDPEYDTPGILKYYATSRGIDTDKDFSLLTGPEEVIDDVLKVFGLLTYDEDGRLNHTMVTAIVDPSGKIVHRREGSRWSVQEFMERLESLQEKRT